MKDYPADKIRNIALIGHGSSGKTSLTSAFLFDAGATGRLTKVDKGNTVTDYEPEEIDRKISINSAICFVEWKDHKINFVDTPGYSNFLWTRKPACGPSMPRRSWSVESPAWKSERRKSGKCSRSFIFPG